MQAITTKYIGPTNVRGSRIKATAQAGSITLNWDHSLNPDQNHCAAAKALANKLGWWNYGTWHGGYTADNQGVWVCGTGDEGRDYFTLSHAERIGSDAWGKGVVYLLRDYRCAKPRSS